jgi:hypothetical protein
MRKNERIVRGMTTAAEARRIALAAQGFGVARSDEPATGPSLARILAEVRRLGVLQIDSVNVLARAHYLPLFARLGAYDRARLDELAWGPSPALFEYWSHQASLTPVELYPLFRWRMRRAERGEGTWGRIARFAKEKRRYLREVLREIEARGPLAASQLSTAKKTTTGWWEWSDAKHAVETLFWQGRLAVASRRGSFERLYDLPERVIPASVREAPLVKDADAHRQLLEIAARALGVGTEDDLADYWRLARLECRPRLAELVGEGVLIAVNVEGWKPAAYVHRDFASTPKRRSKDRAAETAALVGPFDPIVWYRARAHRVFDFHYRIGIYTPAHQRTHGYYVMPFLLRDALVARVDLKADRAEGVLRVRAAWLEEGQTAEVAEPLAVELGRMARWLGLARIAVERKGTLATALRATVRG